MFNREINKVHLHCTFILLIIKNSIVLIRYFTSKNKTSVLTNWMLECSSFETFRLPDPDFHMPGYNIVYNKGSCNQNDGVIVNIKKKTHINLKQ